jgi:hypothetical protein
MNKWIEFVKHYMDEHKLSWACAITEIKEKQLYKKYPIIGGGDYQDMVRNVMVKNHMDWYDAICHIQKGQSYTKKTRQRKKRLGRNQTSKIISTQTPALVSAAIEVTEHPMVVRASERVERHPTLPNMSHYTKVLTHMMKSSTLQNHSYTPSIHKQLQTIRDNPITSIFGCGLEENLKKTYGSSQFKIRIGSDTNGTPKCVWASTPEAREMFRNNFNTQITLNPDRLIFPMQRYTNCWFNTMFVCFFVSDKGMKFMRFFRHMMIEGKLLNGKSIEPKSLRDTFLLFNAMIEACYNQGLFQNEYSLALNTNNIIFHIYNSIPKTQGIYNVNEYGNPYTYYKRLIQYLEAEPVSVKMIRYASSHTITKFFNSTNSTLRFVANVLPDIIIVRLTENDSFQHKPFIVQYSNVTYRLDSVICRDVKHTHFCCGITCNQEYYIYDGSAFSKLKQRAWPTWLNQDYNWKTDANSSSWNFMRGYLMLYYYRVR